MRIFISGITILTLTIILFTSCEQIPPMGEYVDGDKSNRYSYGILNTSVYYKYYSPNTELKGIFGIPSYRRLKGVNAKSFEVIDVSMGKDKNAVYVGSEKQDHIDAATFHINSDGVACDNKHVFCGDYLNIIDDADPQTFKVVSGEYIWQWAKDNNNYFYRQSYDNDYKKADVDYNSFQFINYSFAQDKNYLYTCDIKTNELIKTRVNPTGFKPVTKYYIHDDKNVYFYKYIYQTDPSLITIPLKKPESVRPFMNTDEDDKDKFITADNCIYYDGEIFAEITTEIEFYKIFSTSGQHYKDKNHVYYENEFVLQADPSTYDYVKEFNYYADDKHIFYKGVLVEGADLESMVRVNAIFTKDKNHVYRRWEIVEGVDPTYFQLLKNYRYYYTDGKKIFYCEDDITDNFFEVEGADINTFRYDRKSKKYKDHHSSYYSGHRI